MTDDEILEKAKEIQIRRNFANLEKLHAERRSFAQSLKRSPAVFTGLALSYTESGRSVKRPFKEILEKLPEEIEVRVTVEVLGEVGL